MRTPNPNLPLLESVVSALGPLCPRFVFVGGSVAAWQPSAGCIAARRPHFMGAAAGYRRRHHEVGSR